MAVGIWTPRSRIRSSSVSQGSDHAPGAVVWANVNELAFEASVKSASGNATTCIEMDASSVHRPSPDAALSRVLSDGHDCRERRGRAEARETPEIYAPLRGVAAAMMSSTGWIKRSIPSRRSSAGSKIWVK
jgi:hypothetical protein